MITEELQLDRFPKDSIPPVSQSHDTSPFTHGFNFEPQQHTYKQQDGQTFVQFHGPLSLGMEYFIEREERYKKGTRLTTEQGRVDKLEEQGIDPLALDPHYFLPMIISASAETPDRVAEVEPTE